MMGQHSCHLHRRFARLLEISVAVTKGRFLADSARVVASAVPVPPRAFMPQASVELHDSLELVVLDVLVDSCPVGYRLDLTPSVWQPVRSLDANEILVLEQAIHATDDIGQDVLNQLSMTLSLTASHCLQDLFG